MMKKKWKNTNVIMRKKVIITLVSIKILIERIGIQ